MRAARWHGLAATALRGGLVLLSAGLVLAAMGLLRVGGMS